MIDLDANASTPAAPEVIEAVARAMREAPANPSSAHHLGQAAARVVSVAREQVADGLGCSAREVVFTSGATEANNLALLGVWAARSHMRPRISIVIGATEHPSVMETARVLIERGAEVRVAPTRRDGTVTPAAVEELVDESTLLVSVMLANNETGVVSPVQQIVEVAHAAGALVHTDATQVVGRIPFSFSEMGVDLASVSAHKFHGPRGVGALLVARGTRMQPLLAGGGQERGLRSGTLNTPGIAGMGAACLLIPDEVSQSTDVMLLRDRLRDALCARIPDASVNGAGAQVLPNTLNIRFPGAEGDAVMAGAPQVACSTGSACSAGAHRPSSVLTAMGLTEAEAAESLRFSLTTQTSRADIDMATELIAASVTETRTLNERHS